MSIPFRCLVALTLCLVPAVATGPGTAVAPLVAWWPRAPLQGSLVRVVVRPPTAAGESVTAVHGELAGEPLHFERFADGFRTLGAVPFGAHDSAAARVISTGARNQRAKSVTGPLIFCGTKAAMPPSGFDIFCGGS